MIKLICELFKAVEELEEAIKNDEYGVQIQCINRIKTILAWGEIDV